MYSKLINIIDIGTCSIKASIYQCTSEIYPQIAFKSIDYRLIDPQTQIISDNSQTKATLIIKDLLLFGEKYKTNKNICIATYSIRSAKNAEIFLTKLEQEYNVRVNILNGLQEAQFIADSVRITENLNHFFSFDIGGGSIEFNIFDNALIFSSSKNIGMLNLLHILKNNQLENSLENVQNLILKNINDILEQYDLNKYPLLCTGGSAVIAKQFLKTNNKKYISRDEINNLCQKIYHMGTSERINFGIPPGKADIFDLALTIVLAIMQLTKNNLLRISLANVRHGIAINYQNFD